MLLPVLLDCSETMIWRKKERSLIRVLQVNNLRSFLGVLRMDRVANVQIRELSGDEGRGMKI